MDLPAKKGFGILLGQAQDSDTPAKKHSQFLNA